MHCLSTATVLVAQLISLAFAGIPHYNPRAFNAALSKRENADNSSDALVVDLGYERYRGVANQTSGLNTWLGYAAKCHCLTEGP